MDGFCQLDVFAQTDNERDEIMDRLVQFITMDDLNDSDLSMKRSLMDRRIHINSEFVQLSGDSEIPLGQNDGSLSYADGIRMQFLGEYGTFTDPPVEPLENLEFDLTVEEN